MSSKETLQQENDQYAAASRRQGRYARRAMRRVDRQVGGLRWLVGFVLIAIGVLYLLSNTGLIPAFANWWALFLLLPAAGIFSAALGAYHRNGERWSPQVSGLLISGLLFTGLTAVYFFGLSYGWLVPLFLIAAGLLLLAGPLILRA